MQGSMRAKRVRDAVLQDESSDSFLVHFFDKWEEDKVEEDESQWQYAWRVRLRPYEENEALRKQSGSKKFQTAVSIADKLLKDVRVSCRQLSVDHQDDGDEMMVVTNLNVHHGKNCQKSKPEMDCSKCDQSHPEKYSHGELSKKCYQHTISENFLHSLGQCMVAGVADARMEEEEEETGEACGSDVEGFSSSHRNRRDGRKEEGRSRPPSTRRSCASKDNKEEEIKHSEEGGNEDDLSSEEGEEGEVESHQKGRFVCNGGLFIEEIDNDQGHSEEEQSSQLADQMEEEEEVGDGGGSKSKSFSTSHRRVSGGLKGLSRSHSTRRSSARSSGNERNPDLVLPTALFELGGEMKDQRPRPQKSNNSPFVSDVADENPNGDGGSQTGANFPGRSDEGGDDGNDGGGDRGDEGPYRCDDKDASPNNINVVRLRVLPPKTESRSALRWPVVPDDDLTILQIRVYVGEPRRITADDWGVTGAEFVNLVDSIAANPRLSIANENGQDFTAIFQSLVTDEDQNFRTVPVKMRFAPNAEVCDCKIVFKVTAPLLYASPERVLKPKKQTTVFKLAAQPANCEIISAAQMGKFLLQPKEEDPKEVVLLDCAKWLELDSTSGQLTVNFPEMEDLPMDLSKRTQVFCITRTNRRGEMERFELVIEFVQFFLQHTSDELIKGQALSPAILLASLSTSDILSELGVCIIDVVDLVRYGFKISGRKLEIVGTPNAAFDRQEHDYVFDIFLKLLLPGVEIWKLPRLIEKAVMQNTSFGLDKKIAEFKVSARTHKYGFIEP